MIEENSFYWNILDSLDEGIYFADRKRKITYWNKAAEEMTGYSKGDILTKWCGDGVLCHQDQEGNPLCIDGCPLDNTFKSGERYEKDIYLLHKDGSRVPIKLKVLPVFGSNNEVVGAVEVFSHAAKL